MGSVSATCQVIKKWGRGHEVGKVGADLGVMERSGGEYDKNSLYACMTSENSKTIILESVS